MMNVKVSFSVKAQVYGAVTLPTPEEFSEAIRETLLTDYGFDQASVYDVKLEVSDETVYDVKVRRTDES